jgi:hypothetical protein
MTPIRRLATRLLTFVVRHTSSGSQEWANAMLRELDFIESDWAALFWALGSTTAIFRYLGRGLLAMLGKRSEEKEELKMKSIGEKASGIALGVLIALGVVICAFGLLWIWFHFFPVPGMGPVPWWVAVIAIPETIFIVAVITLWRKRRPTAVGILLLAITLMTHFIFHLATHGTNP